MPQLELWTNQYNYLEETDFKIYYRKILDSTIILWNMNERVPFLCSTQRQGRGRHRKEL